MNSQFNAMGGSLALVTALLLMLAAPIYARDSVVDIDQAKAERGRVTPGDTKGFPVSISLSGSYRLTSNLIVADGNTTVIRIMADNVTIDLNGFAIIGPVVCTGAPSLSSCRPFGSGRGIESGVTNRGITVLNGTVRGMGNMGIIVGPNSYIKGVYVTNNAAEGIFVRKGSRVIGNRVYFNNINGIYAGDGSIVSGNTISHSGLDGINTADGCTVINNTSFSNAEDGIDTGADSTVRSNTVRGNGQFGLLLGAGSGYNNNVINANSRTVSVGGVQMGTNVCNGNTTCP